MKKIFVFVLIIALVVAGIIFVPKLAHTCDSCDKFFVGAGYEPNVLSDMVTDEEILCKECAEKQHAVSIALGKSVEDFKLPLFD